MERKRHKESSSQGKEKIYLIEQDLLRHARLNCGTNLSPREVARARAPPRRSIRSAQPPHSLQPQSWFQRAFGSFLEILACPQSRKLHYPGLFFFVFYHPYNLPSTRHLTPPFSSTFFSPFFLRTQRIGY